MKAAVLNQLGTSPVFQNYPEPIPQDPNQIVLQVKAAALKPLDRLRTGGKHVASYTTLPVVVGTDGVGVLGNGTRVYAQGLTRMMAEQALIGKTSYTALPDGLDYSTAAALPNAVIGAYLPMRFKGEMKQGDTILINGATGATGQLAIQVARQLGAGTIIATGRTLGLFDHLKALGASIVISLEEDKQTVIEQVRELHARYSIRIVLDYLWGEPTELILKALQGTTSMNAPATSVRLVTVGDLAGATISLASGLLRSSAIELLGSGIGSLAASDLKTFSSEILPQMFQLAAEGKITISTRDESLENAGRIWNEPAGAGQRVVIRMEE